MKRCPGVRLLSVIFTVCSLVCGSSVLAAPVLFSGNIVTQRVYNALHPGFLVYASGNATGSQMGSSPASFTLPASAISGNAVAGSIMESVLIELPLSRRIFYFIATFNRKNVGKGSFGPFLTPYVMKTLYANTTAYPNDSTSPRSGYMRLKAGSQGFGGNMLFSTMGSYSARRFTTTPLMNWQMYVTLMGLRGSGPIVGPPATNPSALLGSSSHAYLKTIGGDPLEGSSLIAASTRGPWITGTVTVKDYLGTYPVTLTAIGVDERNAAGTTGNISLVTPQILTSFFRVGTQITGRRTQFASTSTLRLNFTPEPGRLALLGSGLLGLFWLRRRRV